MKLLEGTSIILFRYHNSPEVARERLNILRYFNPSTKIYVLDGGYPPHFEKRSAVIEDLVEHIWLYDSKQTPNWKWRHTYQLVKDWYRQVGQTLDFDFMYSYEYDLLTLQPLQDVYPNIDDTSIALGACAPFTNEVESSWYWTGQDIPKLYREYSFPRFQKYMHHTYGLARQSAVCLGPGPLFPKKFLDKWAETEDIALVHEEILYPAYAEAFGFKIVDHGMHPGFNATLEESVYFNCAFDGQVSVSMIRDQLALQEGRRTFHPVKEYVTLEDLGFVEA